jgi:hypothetical protein
MHQFLHFGIENEGAKCESADAEWELNLKPKLAEVQQKPSKPHE